MKVEPGPVTPELAQAGTRLFLVKVINHGNVTAELKVASPQSGNVYMRSNGDPRPAIKVTPQDAANKWADISLYHRPPMRARLSGLALEYQILEVFSRDSGTAAVDSGSGASTSCAMRGRKSSSPPAVTRGWPASSCSTSVEPERNIPHTNIG